MIANNISELIGNTPLVRINKVNNTEAEILLKLEFFNPLGSVKDRLALAMIKDAEREGRLRDGVAIVEPTSGNTGIALAYLAAQRGYHLILTMPESMSEERKRILRALGAELVLTPAEGGMKASVEKATEIAASSDKYLILQQFENPANPEIHRQTTAEEIWRDTNGNTDIFIAAVGTGGTFTGVTSRLKELNPDLKAYAVEPVESPVLSGGKPGPHKIQGIGAGFIPGIMKSELADDIITVSAEEAGEISRRLAKDEGIFVGISAGANVAAALKIGASSKNKGKRIVTIGCDTGERYLSTWLFNN